MGATIYTYEWAEKTWSERRTKPIAKSDLEMLVRVYRAVARQRGQALSSLAYGPLQEAHESALSAIEDSPDVVYRNGTARVRQYDSGDEIEEE